MCSPLTSSPDPDKGKQDSTSAGDKAGQSSDTTRGGRGGASDGTGDCTCRLAWALHCSLG